MSEQAPNLQEAHQRMEETYDLAVNTGVVLAGHPNAEAEGISISKGQDDGYRVATKDASISQPRGQQQQIEAATGEVTGTYYTSPIHENGSNPVNVDVFRNGYRARITGENGKRAAEIIAGRASRRIGHAATSRAINLSQEYLKNAA
jgi:hypothetical protein